MNKVSVNIRMVLLLLMSAFTLNGQNFELEKHGLASGGHSSGGQFHLSASVGQSITDKSVGGQLIVQAGFWQVNNDLIFEDEFE